MKLTQGAVARLRAPDSGRHDYYDDTVRGFGVRVSSKGRRVYIIRKKSGGRDTSQVLGSCSVLTFAQARERAVEITTGRIGIGIERDKGATKISDLSKRYWEDHVLVRNARQTIIHKEKYRNSIDSAWVGCLLRDIGRGEVAHWHNQMQREHGSVGANRRLAMLHSMFTKGMEWDMADVNPAHGVKKFPEKSRERFLSDEELSRFVSAVQKEPEPYRSYYLACLYTGARPGTGGGEHGEVRMMRWADVDFSRKEWKIPDTKNKTDHVVPLVDELVAVLQALPREGEFVFAGRKGTPIYGFSKSWRRLIQSAGLKDFHPHDIRRTFGAILANRGMNMQQIMKAMNHKSVAAAQVYQRIADTAKMEAVKTMREAVAQASVPPTAKHEGAPQEKS